MTEPLPPSLGAVDHFMTEVDDTHCGRCGTAVDPFEVEIVTVLRWTPDSTKVGRNELINTFCMSCWRAIVAATPPLPPDLAGALELVAELEAEHGPVTEAELGELRRVWPLS